MARISGMIKPWLVVAFGQLPFSVGFVPRNIGIHVAAAHVSSATQMAASIGSPRGDSPWDQLHSILSERFEKIETMLTGMSQDIRGMKDDIGDIKGRMGNTTISQAVAQRYGHAYAQELEIRSLADLRMLIPPELDQLTYRRSAEIFVRHLEPFAEPCAKAVLRSIYTEWEPAIRAKQQDLQQQYKYDELESFARALEMAFPDETKELLAESSSSSSILPPVTTVQPSSLPPWQHLQESPFTYATASSPSTSTFSNPGRPPKSSRILMASRFIMVDTVADILGQRDYLSGFSEIKTISQAFLNYFDMSCDMYSPLGPGVMILSMVTAQGRDRFRRTTAKKDPFRLPPDQRLFSLFYNANVRQEAINEIERRSDVFSSDGNRTPSRQIQMDFQGRIDLVPTPEEFRHVLPNKAFCLLKTGQIRKSHGSFAQTMTTLSFHLDLLHAVMVILLTDLDGFSFEGKWEDLLAQDVDFSREACCVTLRLKRGTTSNEQRYTSPFDEMTSIVELVM